MGRILRGALSVTLALGLVAACAAPTLPLPPPAVPNFTTEGVPAGEVKLTSTQGVQPNAIVLIYNTDVKLTDTERATSTQANGNGSWEATIFGKPGDLVEIYEIDPTQNVLSAPTDTQIPQMP